MTEKPTAAHAECKECHEVFPVGHIAICPKCGGRYLKPAAR